ncbi:acetyltransferase [Bordetella ansorpii]|uniref:Acetyltransferase n=1 Tax=Bordetella ansorpii TaxID=288768 RepID=A0A157NTR7_9BORD|nr:GNAT family N-acetyltransferase [Bordetella ansorpii]SAI24675.1 acetyltransferase [Bordetella ansorpii]
MQWNEVSIASQRLHMRPFRADDAGEAYPCITPTLTRYMRFEPPGSEAEFESVWRTWLPKISTGEDITFVIRLTGTGALVGFVGLHRTQDAEPELGIWIRESEHGHGYGGEAVKAVADWAATAFGRAAFIYPVAMENAPSRCIAERLGGVVVGRRDTAKYDAVVYRIPA